MVIIISHRTTIITDLSDTTLHTVMGSRPKSDTKKKQISRAEHDQAMARAIEAYKREQTKGAGEKKKGLRAVCDEVASDWRIETGKDVKLSYTTLRNLVNGGKTLSEFNAEKNWLEKEEQEVVIEYSREMGERGFPLSH